MVLRVWSAPSEVVQGVLVNLAPSEVVQDVYDWLPMVGWEETVTQESSVAGEVVGAPRMAGNLVVVGDQSRYR